MAETIDDEVRSLIDNAYTTARRLVTTNRSVLVRVAKHLIANETVEGEALDELLGPLGGTALGPSAAG